MDRSQQPKDVTEYMVRFVCDMLETWGFGECVLKCQNEPPQIALQNAVVRTTHFKTIPSNTPRYSPGSLGHCESAIKEVEKQIRATLFQMYADYNCNRDKFPAKLPIFPWLVRHAAWTLTRYAIKADGQTSFLKLMSKDYHDEIAEIFRTGLVSHSCQAAEAGRAMERSTLGWKVSTI